MDLWFTEELHNNWRMGVKVSETLASVKSPFQQVDVVRTDLGTMLVIDGKVQVCELDEFSYHEMLTHLPLLTHPDPRRVLVIGGGDGGTMREVMRHPSVEKGILAEIDQVVIDLCKEHLPTVCAGLATEKRLEIAARDASEYIREVKELDAILVDSSDPEGPSERLFTVPFYRELKAALRPGGIISLQAGSPFFYLDQIKTMYQDLKQVFRHVRPYLIAIPTYPSGTWCLMTASDELDPLAMSSDELGARMAKRSFGPTRYYTPQVHLGSLALPPFVKLD